jgi:hypothetical protein
MLKPEGVRTNRAAFGARIKVTVRTADGTREIHRAVSSGASFGNLPLRQEIGLGAARAIEAVEIFWPVTGKTQRITGLNMDHFYKIREGELKPVPMRLKTFRLRKPDAQHYHHHMPGMDMSGMEGMDMKGMDMSSMH